MKLEDFKKAGVGSQLGLRISDFALEKPSNGFILNLCCGVAYTSASRNASHRRNSPLAFAPLFMLCSYCIAIRYSLV
jgi:hypothetical protein